MQYTEKFQSLANHAMSLVNSTAASNVDARINSGAIVLDIRDPDEHLKGHIPGSINISRGKLEMIVEAKIPDLNTEILCYCNANNRGALSAATLRNMGYTQTSYIAGGLLAYNAIQK